MPPVPGTVVGGAIVPTDSADSYPVTDPQWGKGGLRRVLTTTARNAIPIPRLEKGMQVFVAADSITYQLNESWSGGTPVDADWTAFGSGGSIGGTIAANQVAVGTGTNTIGGSSNLTVDADTNTLRAAAGLDWTYNLAEQRYISTTGSDSNNGINPLTPWLTAQHANDRTDGGPTGAIINNFAAGSYSSGTITAPAQFYGRAVGGGSGLGGSVAMYIGDETTPSNVVWSSNDTIFSNERFNTNCNAAFLFSGIQFVGVGGNTAILNEIGSAVVGACDFQQLGAAIETSGQSITVIVPAGPDPLIINNITGNALQCEDGAVIFSANSITATDIGGRFVNVGRKSSMFFDQGLTISATSSATPGISGIQVEGGLWKSGENNTFTMDGFLTGLVMSEYGRFNGEQDNAFEFNNCGMVASLTDSASLITSNDGSCSFSIGGTTPSTRNFSLEGQAYVLNQINVNTGSREIPMSWFTEARALADTDYVLATDWRYKTSSTVTLPGRVLPSVSGWLTDQGISDIAVPIYVAQKPEIFPRFTITYRTANGPAPGPTSVSDSYTVYVNGSATAMSGVIVDGRTVTVDVSPQVLEVGDEVSIFLVADANTLADTITVSY